MPRAKKTDVEKKQENKPEAKNTNGEEEQENEPVVKKVKVKKSNGEKKQETKPKVKKAKKTKNETKHEDEPEVKKAKKNESMQESKEAGDSVAATSQSYPVKENTDDGRNYSMKIISWNVAGVRAMVKKEGHKFLLESNADIICLQETKCDKEKLPEPLKDVEGYHGYWNGGEKAGHNGVGILSKTKPINVEFGIPDKPDHSKEGRTITAEYDKFYLVCCYVPNSGRGLVRLDYRIKEWNKDFQEYLKKLDEKKPVILCGDLNVAHQEIDLKNPKTNKKTAGFTPQEREGFTEFLSQGFVDSFRSLYPEREGAYTFWSYMGNARAKNVGWRLDYFVVSERLRKDLCDNIVHSDVMGSDHCPISLLLAD